MQRSIVEYCSEIKGYRCGYCKRPDTNFSHGLWAHMMPVDDYQDLIDRGWRRSGKYCYKPVMDVTCCPMYTIRCRALEFKATKSQKKVLKRFNKCLNEQEQEHLAGDAGRKMSTCSSGIDEENVGEGRELFVESTREYQDLDINSIINIGEISESLESETYTKPLPSDEPSQSNTINLVPGSNTKLKDIKKELGPDPTKPPCKKAKQLRLERKLEKLREKGIDLTSLPSACKKNKEKQVEDFINELPDKVKKKLEIRLVRTSPPSPEWLATAKETHEVYEKYQMIIHEDKPSKCTESKFRDFLVQSPLLEEYRETGPPCGYGSFHQQYWLDGKIIAVGVIDILPKCVSSVYFFYDPKFMNLALGTYGALREIEFTRHLNKLSPELKYYYLGFYIHTCRKMRYKGNFYPSDLLCPETYTWFPIKDCIPKLEATPYSRLNPDIDVTDDNYPSESDINFIPIFHKGGIMLFKSYWRKFGKKNENKDEIMEFARLVGLKSAKSLILYR